MLKLRWLFVISSILGSTVFAGDPRLHYHVDASRLSTDSFFVDLTVQGLSQDSAVFQFAATAPGSYRVHDAGRFVTDFKAVDGDGQSLTVRKISTNQFAVLQAKKLARLSYRVEDTRDTKINENKIGPMGDTSMDSNVIVVNGQVLFGYFKGHQKAPVTVTYTIPEGWIVGTAMQKDKKGFKASSYDDLVDNPLMFGPPSKLTMASLNVGGADIAIYCYSSNDVARADTLIRHMTDMLRASEAFIGKLPVNRYVFLYEFTSQPLFAYGAWEHNYSSYYILPEAMISRGYRRVVKTAAHEFFHIITPLNVHSEITHHFNFETPTPSRHLWLYEGCTEWAAQIMQVRGGLTTPEDFLDEMSTKMRQDEGYDPTVSLVDLSLGSYDRYVKEYGNIYAKGALACMVLDMKLLDLSKGNLGLREVIQKLTKKYGPTKPFVDSTFFDEFTKMTYPEIGDFFKRHIIGAERLPIEEYAAKAGYSYQLEKPTGVFVGNAGLFRVGFEDGKVEVTTTIESDSLTKALGIRKGDFILKFRVNDTEVNSLNQKIEGLIRSVQPGDSIAWTVERDGKELTLAGIAGRRQLMDRHAFTTVAEPTKEQLEFRRWWLTNK